jgi:hypothetical protein
MGLSNSKSVKNTKENIKENTKETSVESFEPSDKILDVYITPNVNIDQKMFSLKLGSNPEYLENPMGPSGRIYSCRLKRLRKTSNIIPEKESKYIRIYEGINSTNLFFTLVIRRSEEISTHLLNKGVKYVVKLYSDIGSDATLIGSSYILDNNV